MSYKVHFESLIDLKSDLDKLVKTTKANQDDLEDSINNFLSDTSFTGKSADSADSYFEDTYNTIFSAITAIIEELTVKTALYLQGYLENVDISSNFKLEQNSLEDYHDQAHKLANQYGKVSDELSVTISSVSDIVYVPAIDSQLIYDQFLLSIQNPVLTDSKINAYESVSKSGLSSLEDLITQLNRYLDNLAGHKNRLNHYIQPDTTQLQSSYSAVLSDIKTNASKYKDAEKRIQSFAKMSKRETGKDGLIIPAPFSMFKGGINGYLKWNSLKDMDLRTAPAKSTLTFFKGFGRMNSVLSFSNGVNDDIKAGKTAAQAVAHNVAKTGMNTGASALTKRMFMKGTSQKDPKTAVAAVGLAMVSYVNDFFYQNNFFGYQSLTDAAGTKIDSTIKTIQKYTGTYQKPNNHPILTFKETSEFIDKLGRTSQITTKTVVDQVTGKTISEGIDMPILEQ
jgi:hypothetical protein